MATDYYELLGVSRQATEAEIKKAYRRLARELHPDVNQDDPAAEKRFQEVSNAYEVLSDPDKRGRYDRFGPEGVSGMGGMGDMGDAFGGGLGDLFDAFFGGAGGGGRQGRAGPRAGEDLEAVLDLTFEEAVFGVEKSIDVRTAVPCPKCEATGAKKGTSPETCPECEGAGQVRRVRQSILGQMVTATVCPTCSGHGQHIPSPCDACQGEGRSIDEMSYTVEVPAGVDNGSTLRLTGRGAVGPRGGPFGDLYVRTRVEPHPRFEREGPHLLSQVRIGLAQAALGTHIQFETLDGIEDLVIPPGTQTGRVFRLGQRGVPSVQGRGRGDLIVETIVEVPAKLNKAQADLLRQYADVSGESVAPEDSGLLSKIKSAFR
ncbi:MAG: molecular chaperone DnaJ [Acidimicrobiales bacterium]|nr:molecular chaperone DnaJ [Acidimicrobiales bacterium]